MVRTFGSVSSAMRVTLFSVACAIAGRPDAASAQEAGLEALYARIAQESGPLRVRMYVALCDNDSQGIVPVKNRAICDGERPERNIYWATSGGLRSYLDGHGWKRLAYEESTSAPVIVRARWTKTFRPAERLRALGRTTPLEVEIEALAYRGREIRRAMTDYVAEVHGASGTPAPSHVVGYIGHDYFLDTEDDLIPRGAQRDDAALPRGVFALSCYGEQAIRPSITRPGATVLVLNRSLTYPGAWTVGGIVQALAEGQSARGIHRIATEHFTAGKQRPPGTLPGVFSYGS